MKSPNANLIEKFTPRHERQGRLTDAEHEKLAHDLRTGMRAIGIYTDLMQRDIDANPGNIDMQQYCDGINATLQDLTDRLELLHIDTAL